MKDSKKKEVLNDVFYHRPFDSNIDMGGVIIFSIIVVLLALTVLTLALCKLL